MTIIFKHLNPAIPAATLPQLLKVHKSLYYLSWFTLDSSQLKLNSVSKEKNLRSGFGNPSLIW